MIKMNELPKRKRNRLKNFDYGRNGAYFVTICSKNRENILSTITITGDDLNRQAIIILTKNGKIAQTELLAIPLRYKGIIIRNHVIMPNHIHAIITIENDGLKMKGEAGRTGTLGLLIGGYKSGVSRLCGFPIWQRSFYDHVIRTDEDYNLVAQYIENNPINWEKDLFYRGVAS